MEQKIANRLFSINYWVPLLPKSKKLIAENVFPNSMYHNKFYRKVYLNNSTLFKPR